jgi:hypothetical protein
MDFGISSIMLESAKGKNRSALKTMYKAKRDLVRLRFSSAFSSNLRMQKDVLLSLYALATKNLKELRKDKANLSYLGDLIVSDSIRGDYIFDENFLSLIESIGTKDSEIESNFNKRYESTFYISRGIRYVNPEARDDVSEKMDKMIDAKMELIRSVNNRA